MYTPFPQKAHKTDRSRLSSIPVRTWFYSMVVEFSFCMFQTWSRVLVLFPVGFLLVLQTICDRKSATFQTIGIQAATYSRWCRKTATNVRICIRRAKKVRYCIRKRYSFVVVARNRMLKRILYLSCDKIAESQEDNLLYPSHDKAC